MRAKHYSLCFLLGFGSLLCLPYVCASEETPKTACIAPQSLFVDNESFMDDSVQATSKQDFWFGLVATTIVEQEREFEKAIATKKPENDAQKAAQIMDHLSGIYDRINAQFATLNTPIRWKYLFHSIVQPSPADIFMFEINGRTYLLQYQDNRLEQITDLTIDILLQTASVTYPLPGEPEPTSYEEACAYKRIADAVSAGQLFAINNLPNTQINRWFGVAQGGKTAKPSAITKRFMENISFTNDVQKQTTRHSMTRTFANKKMSNGIRLGFLKLQNAIKILQKQGYTGLENRRFAIVSDDGRTPLVQTRLEGSRPIRLFAHVGDHHNTAYFDLNAIQLYSAEALASIIRTEMLKGSPLSATEEADLLKVQTSFDNKFLLPQRKKLNQFEHNAIPLIRESRSEGAFSTKRIKAQLENLAKKYAEPGNSIQWYSIEHTPAKDRYLFSFCGRLFNISYNAEKQKITTAFRELQHLYNQLRDQVKIALELDHLEEAPGGNSWEDLHAKIVHLRGTVNRQLIAKGKNNLAKLLNYVSVMDCDNGYLDEIRFLSKRLEENKDFPDVFADDALQNKAYVVMETLVTPAKRGKPGGSLEITAIRYKGKKIISRELVFVPLDEEEFGALQGKHAARSAKLGKSEPLKMALGKIRMLVGDMPIVTHGDMAQIPLINRLMRAVGKDPLINPAPDTEMLAKRILETNSKDYHHRSHDLHAVMEHFGCSLPAPTHRFRLLRMYQMALQQLALTAREQRDEEGNNWEYQRFMARFDPSDKVMLRREYRRLKKQSPKKIHRATSWDEIEKILDTADIDILFVDYDLTLFNAKGEWGNDIWYRDNVRFMKQFKGRFGDELNAMNMTIAQMAFHEMMDQRIAKILQKAKARGMRIVLLTARQKNGQEKSLHQIIQKAVIPIDEKDILLVGKPGGAGADKGQGILDFLRENGLPLSTKFGHIDDGEHYYKQTANNPLFSGGSFIWYDTDDPDAKFKTFNYYLQEGLVKLQDTQPETRTQSQMDGIGYLFNAFGTASQQETHEQIIAVTERILEALSTYEGNPKFSDFLRTYMNMKIRDNPQLVRSLLIHEIQKLSADRPVDYNKFIKGVERTWGKLDLEKLGFMETLKSLLVDATLSPERTRQWIETRLSTLYQDYPPLAGVLRERVATLEFKDAIQIFDVLSQLPDNATPGMLFLAVDTIVHARTGVAENLPQVLQALESFQEAA